MKQLVFVTGDNCELSDQMRPIVENFKLSNPDVQVLELEAGKDEKLFEVLIGHSLKATPTIASLVDGKKLHLFESQAACEDKIDTMFDSTIDRSKVSELSVPGSSNKYAPTEDMSHQARYALSLIEQGKVQDAGMPVQQKEYTKKIADGQPVTIDEVKEIFFFLFDNKHYRKQGWDLPENLTNARIMWQSQGGCPAFPWSHKIIQEAYELGEIPLNGLGPDYITPEQFLANGEQY